MIGASISETLSPIPPVECLSMTGTGEIELFPVEHGAGVPHGEGERDPLRHGHAAEEHRHGESRDLALGDGVLGEAIDHEPDLGLGQRAAVALLADDFLGEHV
jgi:hypothetical protein